MKSNAQPKRKPDLLLCALLSIVALLAFSAPASAHHHGDSSDEPAGTIASFDQDTGVLTIDLAGGGSISGLVTGDTRIGTSGHCDHGQSSDDRRWLLRHKRHHHHHGGDHGRHHGWDGGSSDDLTPGAVVDDAVLVLEDGKAVFVKVDLAG
jgi:hypothetical protein